MDRPALLVGKRAWCHADGLLVVHVHQQGEHGLPYARFERAPGAKI
jgi:hypothetical protein